MRLRVATFNIRNGRTFDGRNSWWLRRPATAAVLSSIDADVLGLQEAYGFQLSWLLRRLPAHAVAAHGRSRRGAGEQCPVLVKPPARIVEQATAWYGSTPSVPGTVLEGASFPRIFTTASVTLTDGRCIRFTNTHLDERSARRRRAAVEQLARSLDPRVPHLLVGDLNAEPGDPVLLPLADSGLTPVVPCPDLGTNHDFSGRTDRGRIDHIFISRHFEVNGAWVHTQRPGGRLPSDHWPLVADVELREGR